MHSSRALSRNAPAPALPNTKIAPPARADFTFASDNTAGICPEAWAALAAANTGRVESYGADAWTAELNRRFGAVFGTEVEVHLAFNGTAANALALAQLCRSHQSIICHQDAHVDTDECGAPEFFTGGSKTIPLAGQNGKLWPADIEPVLRRERGVHFQKPGAISLTQSTEWSTLYTPDEVRALATLAHAHGMTVHMDGARFANAAATLAARGCPGGLHLARRRGCALLWRDEERPEHFGGRGIFQPGPRP